MYDKIFNKDYHLINPSQTLQKKSVNKAIKLVKLGNVKAAAKAIQPAINELIKMKCKKNNIRLYGASNCNFCI